MAAVTAAAALVAMVTVPGRPDVAAGVALGAGVAGGTSGLALAVLRRIRAGAGAGESGRAEATARMVRAFAGLMLGRMIGYLAFIGAVVAFRVGDPVSFCAGLIGGTFVFQTLEVLYIRRLS